MATIFRQSRFIVNQLACIRRTATSTGTQAKTSAGTVANQGNVAVRDAQRRAAPSDAIRPRPAGEPPLM